MAGLGYSLAPLVSCGVCTAVCRSLDCARVFVVGDAGRLYNEGEEAMSKV